LLTAEALPAIHMVYTLAIIKPDCARFSGIPKICCLGITVPKSNSAMIVSKFRVWRGQNPKGEEQALVLDHMICSEEAKNHGWFPFQGFRGRLVH